jgi:hypothetical protein
MNHYIVVSGNIYDGGYNGEPPDQYACWIQIEAENPALAKQLALHTDEFKNWLVFCRGEQMNPFTELKVEPAEICKHGKCMCCTDCKDCFAEWEEIAKYE